MAETTESKSIFREKSIEQIESPEKLNDYLRVTAPTVWIVLGAIIALLIGVCIWGALGEIDSTEPAVVISDESGVYCLVPPEALEGVVQYRTVTVEGKQMELTPSVLEPEAIAQDTDVYVLMAGDLTFGDVVYPIDVTGELPEGVYTGQLLVEKVTPLSLFFN